METKRTSGYLNRNAMVLVGAGSRGKEDGRGGEGKRTVIDRSVDVKGLRSTSGILPASDHTGSENLHWS